MPELPEVETLRVDLEPHLVGRRFTGAEVFWARSVDRPPAALFPQAIAGHTIEGVERRGKFLILRLDGGAALLVHLRMTGRLRWRERGAPGERHVRVVLHLDDGHELHFDDQRKFGRLYLVADETGRLEVLAKLGPEPLVEEFTRGSLEARLKGRHARLKPSLLDQRFLAGLGNIYVDEALFRARLHPRRRSETLTEPEITQLHEGIVATLRQGIANRGTTLAAYRDMWGTAGLNQEALFVFRRAGQPCPRCATRIEKITVAGRGTHYCPTCQPAPQD